LVSSRTTSFLSSRRNSRFARQLTRMLLHKRRKWTKTLKEKTTSSQALGPHSSWPDRREAAGASTIQKGGLASDSLLPKPDKRKKRGGGVWCWGGEFWGGPSLSHQEKASLYQKEEIY